MRGLAIIYLIIIFALFGSPLDLLLVILPLFKYTPKRFTNVIPNKDLLGPLFNGFAVASNRCLRWL